MRASQYYNVIQIIMYGRNVCTSYSMLKIYNHLDDIIFGKFKTTLCDVRATTILQWYNSGQRWNRNKVFYTDFAVR